MTKEKRNLWLCRLVSLLFLVMLIRYWGIFQLMNDRNSDVFSIIIVVLFYLLNLTSLIGLLFTKSWGFISTYFSIPISTFLFATSYFSFLTDWISLPARSYVLVALNALLLIGVVMLQVERHRMHLRSTSQS